MSTYLTSALLAVVIASLALGLVTLVCILWVHFAGKVRNWRADRR